MQRNGFLGSDFIRASSTLSPMQEVATSAGGRFGDRIQWMAVIIVLCFVSVLLLRSQSAASYPTYALSLLMLATFTQWRDGLRLPLVRWVGALLLWLCLSVFWSDPFEWRKALSVWSRSLLIFLFVVAFAECQLRGQLQRWMGAALTIVGSLVVLAAIVNFYVTDPADGRLNGLGQLDTHVIAALVFGVVLLFMLRMVTAFPSRPVQIAAFAVAVMVGFAVYMSDSRNAWVSVVMGAGAFVLAHRSQNWRQFLVTVSAMGVVLLVITLALAANESTSSYVLPRGDSFRIAIWGETLSRISAEDAVLFGRGILTSDAVEVDGILFPHPHNIYLALVHQGGLVALFLYGVVLTRTFVMLFRHFEDPDAKLGISVLVLAVCAHLLDGHELVDKIGDTWFLVWMPVAVAVGLGWTPSWRMRT